MLFRSEKGLPTLLEAFARIRRPGFHLVIIGSGQLLPSLQRQREALGLGDCCHFVPTTADVPGWLHSLDIFVLPSLSEALSNSLMEAMACGLAVVASDIGGNPELALHGENGLLFPVGDSAALASCLEKLAGDPDLRRKFGTAASGFIHGKFSVSAAGSRMGAIYEQFLTNRS